MANVSFLPAALAEYQEAYAWYFARSARAAVNFQLAVDKATCKIATAPEQWPLIDDLHRRCMLRCYPYSIIYRVANGDIVVVAVAHVAQTAIILAEPTLTGRGPRLRRVVLDTTRGFAASRSGVCRFLPSPRALHTVNARLLLIETSGRVGQVALADGPSVVGVRRLEESRHHARDLAPAVADLLAAASWTPRDLSAVAVSRGPGSYTGLRVGIMSAKAHGLRGRLPSLGDRYLRHHCLSGPWRDESAGHHRRCATTEGLPAALRRWGADVAAADSAGGRVAWRARLPG